MSQKRKQSSPIHRCPPFFLFVCLQVRDQEIPVKRNFVKVVVHVEDCNDHSPAFLRPRYEASISNQAPTGSEVVRVKALDKDVGSNAEITYSLYTGQRTSSYISAFLLCRLLISLPFIQEFAQQGAKRFRGRTMMLESVCYSHHASPGEKKNKKHLDLLKDL